MRSVHPARRADRAGRVAPASPRHPSAAGSPAPPVAGGGAFTPRAAAWPVGISLVWLGLGWRSPQVTYHLALLLGAAGWPLALRLRARRAVPPLTAAVAAGAGLALTLATGLVLAVTGALGGPSLWHGSGALETPLLAMVGAAWGWRAATRPRVGLLGVLT